MIIVIKQLQLVGDTRSNFHFCLMLINNLGRQNVDFLTQAAHSHQLPENFLQVVTHHQQFLTIPPDSSRKERYG